MLDFPVYIKELLFRHDCVVLPSLGGFVANYAPAEFDPVRHTARPPSKHILFNRNLVHNDGLLYSYVSERTGYGYKEVQERATDWISSIRKDIRKGVKFSIDGLGYFYLDKEHQFQFSPEEGNNYLLEAYGLPFLQYREVGKPGVGTYRSVRPETDPMIRQKRIRRWTYGTAAAVLLAALVIVPIQTGYFNRAGIDLRLSERFKRSDNAGQTSVEKFSEPGEGTIQGGRGAPASGTFIVEPRLPDPEYHIIVGSFKDFGNARQLRNQLVGQGYDARILGSDSDYFRVSAGTYGGRENANMELAAVRSEYENAWILNN
jgi:hypothetical protein